MNDTKPENIFLKFINYKLECHKLEKIYIHIKRGINL